MAGSLTGSLVGSGLVEPGVELLGELVLPLAAPLAPPEAEPGFAVSLELDPLIPVDELDEEPGALGLDEAPLDGDVLELEAPGADEVLLVSPRSHAARPRASATATAKMESFMCPPWVGTKEERSKLRSRPNPLIAGGARPGIRDTLPVSVEVFTCWGWNCRSCSGSRASWAHRQVWWRCPMIP